MLNVLLAVCLFSHAAIITKKKNKTGKDQDINTHTQTHTHSLGLRIP